MRIATMVTAAVAALTLTALAPAVAADMPVKARPPSVGVLESYNGSGFYFGIGTHGEADKATVTGAQGQAVGNFAAGGAISGTVGWMKGNGTTWWAAEAMVHYQSIDAGSTIGAPAAGALSSRVGFTERFMFGGPVTAALGMLPNLSTIFPVLPQPIAPSPTHPYAFLALHQDDVSASYGLATAKVWRFRGGAGAGIKQQLGSTTGTGGAFSNVVADIWAEYLFDSVGFDLGLPAGVARATMGNGARAGITLEY